MGTWIAEQITCKLIASSVIEEGDRELYSYGFFLLISKIFFFFVAVIAGLLTDTTVESIIFYAVFMLLRTYAGGIHARTEMSCTVLTTLALIASVLVIKQLEMHTSGAISLLMFGIGSLCILVFSPLDTDGKPLDKHEKRQYKTVCITILIIYVIVALIAWIHCIKNIFYPICCGICLESILLMLGKICDHRESRNHII